jgi:universal stress protein E
MDDAVALRQAVVLPTNNHVKLTVVGTNSDLGKVESESSKGPLRDIIIEARKAELQELANLESSGATIEYKVLIRYERDLVIKSAEPINGISQFFGGMDMKLLRKCPCPLWIVNSTQQKGFREVLTAAAYDQDYSEADVLNAQILEMATSTALSDFAQLHVVHVWHLQYESFLRSRRLNNTDAEGDAIVEEEKAKRKLWLEGLIARHCGAQDKDAIGYL